MGAHHKEQADIIAFLANPQTHGQTERIEIHETHGSIVFLSATRAFKLKRAVRFPYMDYSTQARRKAMCLREFAINSKIAPPLYLGVKGILRTAGHLALGDAEDPAAIDWVVVMRRFAEDSLLRKRLANAAVSSGDMISLAEAIAEFHKRAEVISGPDGTSAMREVIAENLALFRQSPSSFPAALVAEYESLAGGFLDKKARQFDDRAAAGFVRRCHGDLHLNNVCFFEGKPLLFDAIEFNDSFSCIDVGYDLAYLLMDLTARGHPQWANIVFNRYLECTQDYALLDVLPLFLANRSAIKAHVEDAQRGLENAEATQNAPRKFLSDAVSYLESETPTLVSVGGLSGSGKSSVARGLAFHIGTPPGAVILRTDVIRKTMLGVEERTRLPTTAYDRGTNAAVYAKLCETARRILEAGYCVVADAVFGTQMERDTMEAVAQSVGARFFGVWLQVPQRIAEERIAKRKNDASDADAAVLANQTGSIAAPETWQRIDASPAVEKIVAQVRDLLQRPKG